jgi:NAD(P)-dependent dehydrogenase (short-subunit alcohol dehydrogenase family)
MNEIPPLAPDDTRDATRDDTRDAAPSFDVAGQIALVTGAARGIGRAAAIALARAGADVALGFRDVRAGGDVAEAVRALGRRALPLQMDVARPAEIAPAVAEAIRQLGPLDILVNNAGIGPPNPALTVTEADFDATLAVNLKGTFFVSQAVGRAMIAAGRGGRIVNLSSQAGFVALPTESIYCMTKAAIAHLTKCLAVEWAAHGINVNAVAPTFVRTPGTVKWLDDENFRRDLLARIPLGRVGEPPDVAAAVVFLCSPAAAMITGTTLLIDGGWTAR